MSDEEPGGAEEIPSRYSSWLSKLTARTRRPARPRVLSESEAHDALESAARCYARANWMDDAVRTYAQLGNRQQAANLLEQMSRFQQAAEYYELSGDWRSAAGCYHRCDLQEREASCLERAGATLDAAWIWARSVPTAYRAHELIRSMPETRDGSIGEADRLAAQLVEARVEAAAKSVAAAGRVMDILPHIGSLGLTEDRRRIVDWSVEIAGVIDRPDLRSRIYAAAISASIPGADVEWENWCRTQYAKQIHLPKPQAASIATASME